MKQNKYGSQNRSIYGEAFIDEEIDIVQSFSLRKQIKYFECAK